MAVPFVLPDEDDGNAALEQIFNHIHELLRLLQQQLESRQARGAVGASSRVRASLSSRRFGDEHHQHQSPINTLADPNPLQELVTLPALLTALRGGNINNNSYNSSGSIVHNGNNNEVDMSSPTTARRRRRRRTGSESSCCDDSKPLVIKSSVDVGVTVHWSQDEELQQQQQQQQRDQQQQSKNPTCSSDGLLSKLVPPPLSGSIWTAVICVVGWHLLRTR